MRASFKKAIANLPVLANIKLVNWLPLLFAVWLLLSITMPVSIYRAFFHVLIYPFTLYLVSHQYNRIIWKDAFIRIFITFCGYMAITTWLVGDDTLAGDIRAVRWSIEAALGMLAYWIWMQSVVVYSRLWGRGLLFLAGAGACAGLLSSLADISVNARIGGLGMMGQHPIQGASISITLLAVGLFLTHANQQAVNRNDIIFTFLSIIAVCTFVALSQSRAPQVTLLGYLIFFGLLISYQYRRPATFYLIGGVFVAILLAIHGLIGFDLLYEQFKERGTSYRIEIWTAVFNHPPESLLLGHGAGLDFRLTDAAKIDLNDLGFEVYHPHNIWLGAFMDTGIIGVVMQAGLLVLPLIAILRNALRIENKLHLLVILGLFVLLTLTDEYTLLISPHPIWLIGWIPLVFVWSWCRYKDDAQENFLQTHACARGQSL
ncbi:O-antigen ligase family protein [Halomonas vilamensis]|uniref:O-antigen ligase family protein n=1 Tax=Vreelandella vilamensis TaxID=531309 RepID=A0ABU1H3P1_9GAMM|nr:O-antigen ligase family protein [Halomonas vilamensis]MDR5898923.1 O-antigen ligase family protein [Halomonas vilamensis]